ncbi:MAG TPA: TetR family transcriptional regulator [Pseudonocardia sp.]|jgi:AcrR family transcriptional regulator|nr:TetR family transcriptional regulator [Pseudonocardia sp.]
MPERGQRFPGAAREVLHGAILDAAARLVVESDGREVRMADIAAAVDISRQTLYAEFGGKQRLLTAVMVRETERLMVALDGVLARHATDLGAAVRAGCAFVLRRSRGDALLKAVLAGPAHPELLPLVTTEADPVLRVVATTFAGHLARCAPHTDPARAELAADTIARLIVTHVLLPEQAPELAADAIAEALGPYLTDLVTRRPSPG